MDVVKNVIFVHFGFFLSFLGYLRGQFNPIWPFNIEVMFIKSNATTPAIHLIIFFILRGCHVGVDKKEFLDHLGSFSTSFWVREGSLESSIAH